MTYEYDGNVMIATDANFQEILTQTQNEKKILFVNFYAPWCGHCKALAPEYEKFAQQIKNDDKLKDKFMVIKVDCTIETHICNTYEVKGYPTIKIFDFRNEILEMK